MQHLHGDEHITFDGMPIGYMLQDFWAWNSSNLLNNTIRGAYCEFIVSAALGLDLNDTNSDWDAYDIDFPHSWVHNRVLRDSVHIEVKSSAYLQAWEQSKPSAIQFSIRPTRAWSPQTGYDSAVKRQSDVYIFCLYHVTDRASADPLNLDGWDFYVLSTDALNAHCGPQKTLSLTGLQSLNPIKTDFSGLPDAVIASLQSST